MHAKNNDPCHTPIGKEKLHTLVNKHPESDFLEVSGITADSSAVCKARNEINRSMAYRRALTRDKQTKIPHNSTELFQEHL